MLVAYLFGLVLGLAIVIATYIGVIAFIRKREAKLLKSLGFGDSYDSGSDYDSKNPNHQRPYINSNSGSRSRGKLTYVCLVCGRKVSGRKCRKCGSCMKKVVF